MQQYIRRYYKTGYAQGFNAGKIDGRRRYNKRRSLSQICNFTTVLRWMECWIRQWTGINGGEVNNAKNNVGFIQYIVDPIMMIPNGGRCVSCVR